MAPRILTDGEKDILRELNDDAWPTEEEMRQWEQDQEDGIAPPEPDFESF